MKTVKWGKKWAGPKPSFFLNQPFFNVKTLCVIGSRMEHQNFLFHKKVLEWKTILLRFFYIKSFKMFRKRECQDKMF